MNERFKGFVPILIAIITVVTAIVAYLQSDASNRDDRSGRDANSLAVEMLGQNINGNSRSYYDYNEAFQTWFQLDVQATAAQERGDDAAAVRYTSAAEQIRLLSPLLQAPYFDEGTGDVDFARYEVDTFRARVTQLGEEYTAAAGVKDAWDTKANTYIVHLTILAVSLFLLGLAASIDHPASQVIFVVVGSALALVAVVWAALVYAAPVFDLRTQPAAIEAYTRGVGLVYQNRDDEALAAFNEAVTAYPDYAAVYVARGGANLRLSNYEAAAADFEQARTMGAETPSMLGDLAIAYYYLGQFSKAIALQQSVVENSPSELWVQFDLGATQLISGQVDAARATYEGAMQAAIAEVQAAQQASTTPSSQLWYGLNFGVLGLEEIRGLIANGEGTPDPALIPDPAAVDEAAGALIKQIKELTVGLEYQGTAPSGSLSATISNFTFGVPVYADDGTVSLEVGEAFISGVSEMSLLFDYDGLRDGQMIVIKVYIDGDEDPSWRIVRDWDGGTSGSEYEIPLAIAYSDTFILSSATYTVEMYVDGLLAGSGEFVIEE
jgi:tetratricopeptide (TPR) repeat protein